MPNDASRAASTSPLIYGFAAPGNSDAPPIVVHSDYAIEPYMRLFLLGWPMRRLDSGAPADIVLRRVGQRAAVALAGRLDLEMDAMSEFDGVNRLADVLSNVAARRIGSRAELHASAALVGRRLALFVGPSLSGKSSLALQLAVRGCRLFGDDRVLVGPLEAGAAQRPVAMALGLTPRVRLPPHPAAGRAFADFVATHAVPAGGDVGMLPLSADIAAGFAEAAPIGALFLPERRENGGIEMRPAGTGAASRAILEQMHAPQIAAAEFIAAVRRLVGGLPAWHLRYDDSAAAAAQVMAALRD